MERAKTELASEWVEHEYTKAARDAAEKEYRAALANLRNVARTSTDPRVTAAAANVERYEESFKFFGGRL